MRFVGLAGNLGSGKDTVAELLKVRHGFVVVAFADELKRVARRLFMYSEYTLFGPSDVRNLVDARAAHASYWTDVARQMAAHAPYVCGLFAAAPEPPPDEVVLRRLGALIDDCKTRSDVLTARYVLQRLGTEWGRSLWPKVWIHRVARDVAAIRRGHAYDRIDGLSETPVGRPRGVAVSDTRFPNEGYEIRGGGGRCIWVDADVRKPLPPELRHASEPTRAAFRVEGPTGVVDLIDYDIDNNGALEALPARVDHAVVTLFAS